MLPVGFICACILFTAITMHILIMWGIPGES